MSLELNVNKIEDSQRQNAIEIPKSSEFLSDISVHRISKEFSNLGRDNRTLIVPIGFPQAGKSLLISSLMYYAIKGKETLFRANFENQFPYDKGRQAVDQMVGYFDQGKLYATTQGGTLDLIGVNITPSKPKKPILKLAFLDLAGEDIKKIKTSEGALFTEKINAVFNGLKIDDSPIIFALITPFEPAKEGNESSYDAHNREDALHYDFLNYLKQDQPQLLKNSKFFVIVSQWDKNQNENETVESFIEKNRPSIFSYVKNSDVIWGEYSIGKLLVSTVNGLNIQEIVRINHDYPSRFWKKLYHICTGKELDGLTWWEKLAGKK